MLQNKTPATFYFIFFLLSLQAYSRELPVQTQSARWKNDEKRLHLLWEKITSSREGIDCFQIVDLL